MWRKWQRSKHRRADKRGRFALLLWLSLLISVLLGCGQPAQPELEALRIGVIAPFSGDFAALGRAVRDGTSLAVEVWNQTGGIYGRPVQLVLEDSGCDYQQARAAAQELLVEQEILFVIGAVCADASEGVAQIASDAAALQISPASVDLDLTLDAAGDLRPLVFRIPFTDVDQGVVAAKYALQRMEAEEAAILHAEGSSYGGALAEAFLTTFEAGGGEVATVQTYDLGAELFFEALERIRDADPDVIYAPGYYPEINVMIEQARDFGMFQPFLGSDGWHAADLDLEVVDGCYFTTHFYVDEARSAVRAWNELFEARYLVSPDALATLSYDAANVLFTTIVEAESFDPFIVARAMEMMSFDTISGWMAFDENHNPIKAVPMLAVDDQQVTLIGRFFAQEPVEDTEVDEE
jgi:branched-chain amino acid transport system substrate-binding protein